MHKVKRQRNFTTWLDGEAPNSRRYYGAEIPASAIITTAAVTAVAAGVSTYMAVQQAENQEDQAEAIAEQKKDEAAVAAANAAFEEGQFRRKLRMLLGKQTAITAASGISTQYGSPLYTEIDTAEQGELEALQIRAGGLQAAAGKLFERNVAEFQAENARSSIPWLIAGGVMQGASSAVGTYGTMYRPKTTTSVLGDWYTYGHASGSARS